MRFFVGACIFGVIVASLGCMTQNWSKKLFSPKENDGEMVHADDSSEDSLLHWLSPQRKTPEREPASPLFASRGIGDYIFGNAIDPRVEEVNRHLGYK